MLSKPKTGKRIDCSSFVQPTPKTKKKKKKSSKNPMEKPKNEKTNNIYEVKFILLYTHICF